MATLLLRRRNRLSAITAVVLLLLAAALGGTPVGSTAADVSEKRTYWAVRRRLIGPGSSPPTCHARCGRCFPCRPIHVAVHPAMIVPLDYYPEAWRCKCRSRLFMP